jgi:hypothetical protein
MLDFLNHLVAARLMTDAERFERIEQFGRRNRLLGHGAVATQPRTVSARDGRRRIEHRSRPSCAPHDTACEAGTLAR